MQISPDNTYYTPEYHAYVSLTALWHVRSSISLNKFLDIYLSRYVSYIHPF